MEASDLGFIHRWLPAQAGSQTPTLLLLHGTGGDENDLLKLGQMLAPGAALLSPRGKVLEHGMPRFFRRIAEGVLDQEDLARRTQELADFIEHAAEVYGFDRQQVIAAGFSNGANIAASMLLRRPEVLAGAALFHPMLPFVPETTPDLSGKPIFIGAGQLDPLVPTQQTEQLAALLQHAGAQVSLSWQPGGHTLGLEEVRAAADWMQHIIGA